MLHRFLLDAPKGIQVDHKNGDTLDNRRENLRLATHSQNMMNRKLQKNNTSGVCGVTWDKSTDKWMAHIAKNGTSKTIGYFEDIESAKNARLEFEEKMFKEFSRK